MVFLRKFDFEGVNNFYNIDGSKKLTSQLGGLLNIFSLIILALLFYSFGQNFYKRENPQSNIQETLSEIPKKMKMTFESFPISFRIEDENSYIIQNYTRHFNINVYYNEYVRDDNNEFKLVTDTTMNIIKCDSYVSKENIFFSQVKNSICIDYNLTDFNMNKTEIKESYLGGGWDEPFFNTIFITIKKCEPNITNSFGEICESEENQKEYFDKTYNYLSFYYPQTFFDPYNFTFPVKTKLKSSYFYLTKKLIKSVIYKFQDIIVDSDIGWIFSEYITEDYISIYEATIDYDITEDSDFAYLEIAKTSIIKKYVRIYMKIQELSANIGGVLKVYSLLLSIILYHYNSICLNYNLLLFIKNSESKSKLSKDIYRSSLIKMTNNSKTEEKPLSNRKGHKKILINLQEMKIIENSKKTKLKQMVDKVDYLENISFQKYFFQILQIAFCYCCLRKNSNLNRNIYFKKYLSDMFNIKNYIILRNEFEIMKDRLKSDWKK